MAAPPQLADRWRDDDEAVGRAESPDRDDERALASVAQRTGPLAARRGLDPRNVLRLLGVDAARSTVDREPFASPDAIGLAFEQRHGPRTVAGPRKERGAFFTPPSLASALATRTLDQAAARPWTLDPAAGAGAVLLAALRTLKSRHEVSPAELCTRLCGVELDPVAARLCRLALWLECADADLDPELFERTIRVGDPLLAPPPGADLDSTAKRALAAMDPARVRPLSIATVWPQAAAQGGFDVVIGNPPWQIAKPDSRAFFAPFDPSYRHRHKQDALRMQRDICSRDPAVAAAWERELTHHAAFASYCRARFRLQGRAGDPNLYKLFVECGLDLLRPQGRLGMLVPAGLHSDLGTRELRTALMNEHRWELLWGFENRARLFPDVDSRFKFDAIIVRKGGRTARLEAAFMSLEPELLGSGSRAPVAISHRTWHKLAPRSRAIPELRSRDELMLLEHIHDSAVPFGDQGPHGWRLTFRRELDMTADSRHFAARDALEARGLVPDQHGRWLQVRTSRSGPFDPLDATVLPLADGRHVLTRDVLEVWHPLWEGRMVDAFEPAAKGWVAGRARRAQWRVPERSPWILPQYLVSATTLHRVDPDPARVKVGFLAIASATNTRTMLATALCRAPCGNSVPVVRSEHGDRATLALCAVLCSLVYDHALRTRLGGTNLNRFTLDETPLPQTGRMLSIDALPSLVAALCWTRPRFAEGWSCVRGDAADDAVCPPPTGGSSRLATRAALDALVAAAFDITADDLARIVGDAWRPTAELSDRQKMRGRDPKGLWRIDRDRPPEARLPVLAVAARHALQDALDGADGDWALGTARFLRAWRLPAALDLRELGFRAASPGLRRLPADVATDQPPATWQRVAVEAQRAAAFDHYSRGPNSSAAELMQ